MARLCSERSRSYPGRPARHAVGIVDSGQGGNVLGDRTGVSRGHSRCWKVMKAAHRLETSRDPRSGGNRGDLTPLKDQTQSWGGIHEFS
jgi:hypothetical protein